MLADIRIGYWYNWSQLRVDEIIHFIEISWPFCITFSKMFSIHINIYYVPGCLYDV